MPYTFHTTILVIAVLIIGYIFFDKILPEYIAHRRALKALKDPYPSARKPTKAEILERNEIDRLLELDEYPTIVRQINLDQHEKAIS